MVFEIVFINQEIKDHKVTMSVLERIRRESQNRGNEFKLQVIYVLGGNFRQPVINILKED